MGSILFYAAFLSQILLISFYLPKRVYQRLENTFEKYPPSEFPELYPKKSVYYVRLRRAFWLSSLAIGAVGLLLMLAFGVWGYPEARGLTVFPIVYGVVQFIPFMTLEIHGLYQRKLIAQNNPRTKRSAVLRPRRLFDFAAPSLVTVAVALYVASVLVDLYIHQFQFHWSHDTFQRTVVATLTNLVLLAVILGAVHRTKFSYFQDYQAKLRNIEVTVKSIILVSIALSMFIMFVALGDAFDTAPFEPAMASLYFQAIVLVSVGRLLRNCRVDRLNTDAYENGDELLDHTRRK